jgi:DNA-binding GntR family transcriptional regulator
MTEFLRRLHYLVNRRRFDRELESDMQFHREMAARAGRANFGNMLQLREDGGKRGDGPGSTAFGRIYATAFG